VQKSKDFQYTKTKAHKIIFVCFQFCVLFGFGLSELRFSSTKNPAEMEAGFFRHRFGGIFVLSVRIA